MQIFRCKQGWSIEENPVSTSFEIFWMIFEPILFGVTGASVKISELDQHLVVYGLIALTSGAILRILTTTLISFGDKLNWKERVNFEI
jgi:solute carrier family 9B (sodium/hydrogen exchanger), member 1/2